MVLGCVNSGCIDSDALLHPCFFLITHLSFAFIIAYFAYMLVNACAMLAILLTYLMLFLSHDIAIPGLPI